MGRAGSTTSPRVQEMRRVLVRWQRSGLTLREFGQQRGIPVSTLTWWRQVFRRAGDQLNAASKSVPARDAVVFTEVPQPATVPTTSFVVEIVLRSGHMVRVPEGADTDTLQRVLQALQTC
ncbi:MAG: IS66 family insertion sequence element accessory protein TnpA [Candidatus Binataceae bacterium]